MKNGFKIQWSDRAIADLQNILDYLLREWSQNEVRNFVRKLDKRLDILSTHPRLYPKTGRKRNIRRSVLSKQTVIYYQTTSKGFIRIITLFDSRQNPNKLKI